MTLPTVRVDFRLLWCCRFRVLMFPYAPGAFHIIFAFLRGVIIWLAFTTSGRVPVIFVYMTYRRSVGCWMWWLQLRFLGEACSVAFWHQLVSNNIIILSSQLAVVMTALECIKYRDCLVVIADWPIGVACKRIATCRQWLHSTAISPCLVRLTALTSPTVIPQRV